jgi:16S rRNA processing protein RimM
MKLDDCYQLGWVVKPHGTKGEVSIILDVDKPEEYREMESVFVELNKILVPFFIEWIRVKGNKALVKFEGLDNLDRAVDIQAKKLYLPMSMLPELKEDQFYYHDIVGYSMHDKEQGVLGPVENIYTKAGQDLFAVAYKGREVLVPVTDSWILGVDHKMKVILVELPDGLLDIYLS